MDIHSIIATGGFVIVAAGAAAWTIYSRKLTSKLKARLNEQAAHSARLTMDLADANDLYRLREARFDAIQRSSAECKLYEKGWRDLVVRFEFRHQEFASAAQNQPSHWTNANEVRRSLREFRAISGIPFDGTEAPIQPVKQRARPTHWKDVFIPGDLTDSYCPPWEMLHLPTSGRLTVGHLRGTDAEHWHFEIRVAPPTVLDDDGQISLDLFERHCLRFQRVIPYALLDPRDYERACTLGKAWYRRMLFGPTPIVIRREQLPG